MQVFQVVQMSDMFENRPFPLWFAGENGLGEVSCQFLDVGECAPKPFENARVEAGGEIEVELPFDPWSLWDHSPLVCVLRQLYS